MFEGGLAELHTHLGGSVGSEIMWSLAHEQGIALPVKDFWEFDRLVTVSDPRGVPDLNALDAIYHWAELIQSSPLAVERSVHAAIGGAYRSQGITTLELRFNPMKRNRGGERDLDHIILAAIRGLDRAHLEYPQVQAGLILMMDRTFTARQNEIIVEKAIAWASRGVVGVDIAGPRPGGGRYDYRAVQPMVEEARAAGLGVTIHVGEEGGDMGREELAEVLEVLRPDRIGHGILAAIRGLDRARLEYPQVRAGLILMMDRTFTNGQNAVIVEKALHWAPRGVVGVDIAGPRPDGKRYDYRQVIPMIEEARGGGLGVTIHVGEEGGDFGREEIGEVIEALQPDRIGHGILAAGDAELMTALREREIVLEICPTSNLLTKALPDEEAIRATFRAFAENNVLFTIATDGPEMMRTHLRDEFELLLRVGALDEAELRAANARGHEAAFVNRLPVGSTV